jgi:hypothetical protein
MTKPGETAAAGTSAVTATAGKKRTISDFFSSNVEVERGESRDLGYIIRRSGTY